MTSKIQKNVTSFQKNQFLPIFEYKYWNRTDRKNTVYDYMIEAILICLSDVVWTLIKAFNCFGEMLKIAPSSQTLLKGHSQILPKFGYTKSFYSIWDTIDLYFFKEMNSDQIRQNKSYYDHFLKESEIQIILETMSVIQSYGILLFSSVCQILYYFNTAIYG